MPRSIGGALTRSVDCCTWPLPGLRLAGVRSFIGGPLPAARAIGILQSELATSLDRSAAAGDPCGSRRSGRRARRAMSETHCVTTLSRRFGPLDPGRTSRLWSGARRWWRRPCRPTCPEAPPTRSSPRPGDAPLVRDDVDALLLNVHAALGAILPVVCRTICRSAVCGAGRRPGR